MCGRYNIITSAQALHDAFKIISDDLDFAFVTPDYNVYPTPAGAAKDRWITAPIIRLSGGKAETLPAVWLLIPKWAKGQIPKYSTCNAKAENVATTKSYQHAWKRGQRCLVPATGIYEWQAVQGAKTKQPYNITVSDQPAFAMGGIWELSTDDRTGESVLSYSILTTQANPLMAEIHNTKKRMPVIIAPDDYQQWLEAPAEDARKYLTPYPADKMSAYKVNTYVNNPNNNDERCIEPMK